MNALTPGRLGGHVRVSVRMKLVEEWDEGWR